MAGRGKARFLIMKQNSDITRRRLVVPAAPRKLANQHAGHFLHTKTPALDRKLALRRGGWGWGFFAGLGNRIPAEHYSVCFTRFYGFDARPCNSGCFFADTENKLCFRTCRICNLNTKERDCNGSSETRTESGNLQRTMRRTAEETQGEGRFDGRRRGKNYGRQQKLSLSLGNWPCLSQGRTIGSLGGNSESQVAAISFSGKINFPILLKFLERSIDLHSNFVRIKASNKKALKQFTISKPSTPLCSTTKRQASGVFLFDRDAK